MSTLIFLDLEIGCDPSDDSLDGTQHHPAIFHAFGHSRFWTIKNSNGMPREMELWTTLRQSTLAISRWFSHWRLHWLLRFLIAILLWRLPEGQFFGDFPKRDITGGENVAFKKPLDSPNSSWDGWEVGTDNWRFNPGTRLENIESLTSWTSW